MAIKRPAGGAVTVTGCPRFLGNWHLSYHILFIVTVRVVRRRLSLTGICTSISSHLKIDRSGGGESSHRQTRGKSIISGERGDECAQLILCASFSSIFPCRRCNASVCKKSSGNLSTNAVIFFSFERGGLNDGLEASSSLQ